MNNIIKYKSKRSIYDHKNGHSERAHDSVAFLKRHMRRALRRCLKKVDDETGGIIAGTYWT